MKMPYHKIVIIYTLFFLSLISISFAGNRTYDANETKALADMQALTDALTMCEIDTTYYVSLETLNDIGFFTTTPTYDYINYEGGTFVIRPEEGKFRNPRINLLTAYFPWQGPYINYQPGTTQTGTTPYDQGSPIDPWGNPYLFYSPLGLLRGDTGQVTLDFHGDSFDRYTIASLGRDGIISSDDLYYQFGGGLSTVAISSIRGNSVSYAAGEYSVTVGSDITVRGYNFGTTQGNNYITFGNTNLSNVTGWSSREINITLPPNLTGTNQITVHIGTSTSNSVTLTITSLPTAVNSWEIYD